LEKIWRQAIVPFSEAPAFHWSRETDIIRSPAVLLVSWPKFEHLNSSIEARLRIRLSVIAG